MIGFMDNECSIGVIKLELDQVTKPKHQTEDVDMNEEDIDID
jgi:hypothetical protein